MGRIPGWLPVSGAERWRESPAMLRLLTAAAVMGALAAPAAAAADSIVYIDQGNVWSAKPDGSHKVQLTAGGGWHSPTQAGRRHDRRRPGRRSAQRHGPRRPAAPDDHDDLPEVEQRGPVHAAGRCSSPSPRTASLLDRRKTLAGGTATARKAGSLTVHLTKAKAPVKAGAKLTLAIPTVQHTIKVR